MTVATLSSLTLPALKLRQIATNTFFPGSVTASVKQLNSQTPHYARDDITSLQVAYVGAYGLSETSAGDGTITVSVEYPTSTYTQFKFSGATIGNLVGGAFLFSDMLPISIPNGAKFNIRCFYQNAAGIIKYALPFADSQFLGESAASGLTDKTMGGSLGTSVNVLPPVALLAYTRNNAVAIIGDSIAYGTFTAPAGTGKDVGIFNACLGPSMAVMNIAAAGESASGLYARTALRRQLLQYVTGVFCNEGNNDNTNGGAPSKVLIDQSTIAHWPELIGKKKYISTLFPKTTTSTNWLTRPPQTPAANEANRITANDAIRLGVSGYDGMVDFANVFEGGIDLGTWYSDGVTSLTQDGTHLVVAGANFGVAAGILTASMFT